MKKYETIEKMIDELVKGSETAKICVIGIISLKGELLGYTIDLVKDKGEKENV